MGKWLIIFGILITRSYTKSLIEIFVCKSGSGLHEGMFFILRILVRLILIFFFQYLRVIYNIEICLLWYRNLKFIDIIYVYILNILDTNTNSIFKYSNKHV